MVIAIFNQPIDVFFYPMNIRPAPLADLRSTLQTSSAVTSAYFNYMSTGKNVPVVSRYAP